MDCCLTFLFIFLVDLNLSGVPGSSPNGALGDESSPNWSTPAPSDGTSPGDLTATDISAPAPGGSSAATPSGDLSRADPQSLESATSNQIDKYNLIMGFYNTPASQPTLAEVDALMCEAKKYFTEYLRNQLKDASLVVSVTNIGFSYNADCQTPMNVFFTVEASHSSGSSVDSEDIFRALRLGEDEILDIIQNYVWKSEPGTNVFRTVNQLTFESTLGAANFLPEGIIAEATCSIQAAPAPFPAQPARIGTYKSPQAETYSQKYLSNRHPFLQLLYPCQCLLRTGPSPRLLSELCSGSTMDKQGNQLLRKLRL